jgi:hypothetical protein
MCDEHPMLVKFDADFNDDPHFSEITDAPACGRAALAAEA